MPQHCPQGRTFFSQLWSNCEPILIWLSIDLVLVQLDFSAWFQRGWYLFLLKNTSFPMFFRTGFFEEIILNDQKLEDNRKEVRLPPTSTIQRKSASNDSCLLTSCCLFPNRGRQFNQKDIIEMTQCNFWGFHLILSQITHSYYKTAYSTLAGLWRAPDSIEINSQHQPVRHISLSHLQPKFSLQMINVPTNI